MIPADQWDDIIRESAAGIAVLLAAIAAFVVTLVRQKLEAEQTRAEIATLRKGQEDAHAETKEAMLTNHGSTSLGNAVDRIWERFDAIEGAQQLQAAAQRRQASATTDLQAEVSGVRRSVGGLRDDVRGLRSETSDRVSELADRITAESERQTSHEQVCPARIPLRHSISHPPNADS